MAGISFVSARMIQLEIFLPDSAGVAKLRKAFAKEFELPSGLHCGKGDRGGCSIISAQEAYIRFVVGEEDERRLFEFVRNFLSNEGIEFSTKDR